MAQYLEFGGRVALCNLKTGKYLCYDLELKRAFAHCVHPFCKGISRPTLISEFTIASVTQKDYKPMTGVPFLLKSSSGALLSCLSNGELKFEQFLQQSDPNKAQFIKPSTWVASGIGSTKEPLKWNQEVTLRSALGLFLLSGFGDVVTAVSSQNSLEACWRLVRADAPPAFVWVEPYGSAGLCRKEDRRSLSETGVQQQQLLIDDLLNALIGYEGIYIKKRQRFQLQNLGDRPPEPLLQMTQKILALAEHHIAVDRSIGSLRSQGGQVGRALAAGLQVLLREFVMMVTNLEDQQRRNSLTLQKLWFYVQPSLGLMGNLHELCERGRGFKGGALLNIVWEQSRQSQETGLSQVLSFLLCRAADPFVRLLQKWLNHGLVEDPFDEFMVRVQDCDLTTGHYWHNHFKLVGEHVPQFLKRLQPIILNAGKYLDVIAVAKEPTQHIATSLYRDYERLLTTQDFRAGVQLAHDQASRQLMQLVKCKYDLFGWLLSMKGFFLLQYGDLYSQFLQQAGAEVLSQKLKGAPRQRLQTLFEALVKATSACADPHRAEFRIKLGVEDAAEDRVLKQFWVEVKQPWPLILIFSRLNLQHYQKLFRHGLMLKATDQALSSLFMLVKGHKGNSSRSLKAMLGLTQRMVHFMKNVLYNFSYEVVEHNWQILTGKLKRATNFEEILSLHSDFLKDCLRDSLLESPVSLELLTKINDSCMIYTSFFAKNDAHGIAITDPDQEQTVLKFIQGSNNCFTDNLAQFMSWLRESRKKGDAYCTRLLGRLDSQDHRYND